MKTNSRLAAQILAGFLFLVIAGLVVNHFVPRSLIYGQLTINASHARQLAIACDVYAADHGGRFPVHLDELTPIYVPNPKSLRGIARDENDRELYTFDWLYFGRGFTEDKPPAMLLASPAVTAIAGKPQKRVVVNRDGACAIFNEDQYEKVLAKTVRQTRELDDREQPAESKPAESPAK